MTALSAPVPSGRFPTLALCLAPLLVLAACSDPLPTEQEATLMRERAAAHFAKDQRSLAREDLKKLVEHDEASAADLVRAAAVELADNQPAKATALLDRAEKRDANVAGVHWLRAQIARESGDGQGARARLVRALELAPDDLPARIALAEVEEDLGNPAETERLLREVIAVGASNGGAWYVAAVYRLSNLLTRAGREDEAARFDSVRAQLAARGLKAPDALTALYGELGRVKPPRAAGSAPDVPERAPAFEAGALLEGSKRATRLLARDLDGDLATDLVAYGPDGVWIHANDGGKLGAGTRIFDAPTTFVLPFDLENDGDLDLAVLHDAGRAGGALALYRRDGAVWVAQEVAWPAVPAGLAALEAVDYDHEGDLDLVLAGSFGLRVWRNDSKSERDAEGTITLGAARFADASAGAGLAEGVELAWVVPEDYDGDNDVDLLAGGAGGVQLFDSLRDGKFQRTSGGLALQGGAAAPPLVADFDGDARADVWFAGAPSYLALNGQPGRRGPDAAAGDVAAGDVDLDGALDALWLAPGTGVPTGERALGLAGAKPLATGIAGRGARALALLDFDLDGKLDLALAEPEGIRLAKNAGPTGRGARIAARGKRDNARAAGAVVEYRAGPIYRRVYWRGEPELLGTGAHERFDVLRITWPNGVVDTRLDVPLGSPGPAFEDKLPAGVIAQTEGQVGSCPFLYTFDGTRNVFVSDVLGITPLGLRMAPDMLVPPDHDEYVLVRGSQLAPKDGRLELHLTEELREVTYLDHARLYAVDHPSGTEVYPNELFCFPPFPAHHVHSVRAPLAPLSAKGSDAADWTAAVREQDDVVAQPMALHAPQYAGLAKPWFLELSFDPALLADAAKLRLLLTGWFYWSDASANMAAARAGGVDFVPPILQVPDGQGGWRDAGPPVGFPAGKTKTMVVDVSAILDRADPRLRVFTTLRLYWDRVALATDGDDAELLVREVPPLAARAWRRGFSAPLDSLPPGEAHPANKPERFDWDRLADAPRWNQHPGNYTRYGECLELVTAVDDRFAILGAGDALTLAFDARELPPPAEGATRDWLVYLDGWAKDRDPNTLEALTVEPLPFHAMSGYPYRPDERFPDGPEHRKWRAEWLARPAQDWIAPVSPRREREWLLALPAPREARRH